MIRKTNLIIGLGGLYCFLYGFQCHSVEKNYTIEELFELTIVDLMQIDVSVASKRDESVSEAPSIISIVTAKQIQQFGAKNLKDILNRVTSVQGTGSHFYPHLINMRGQLVGHNNSDILFLINGRPRRTSWNGGTPFPILLAFPIDTIDKIEIIRGPGSVLYGTGAFTGVINIITKSAKSIDKTRVAGSAGAFDSVGVDLTTSNSSNNEIMAGIKYFKMDGWSFSATDELSVQNTVDVGENNIGIMLTEKFNNFSVNVLYTDVELDNNIGGPPRWPAGEKNAEHLTIDVGYLHNVNNRWTLDNHITYNAFDFLFEDTPPVRKRRDSQDVLVETTLIGSFDQSFDFIIGATYENISGKTSDTLSYSSNRYSLYSQLDYKPKPNQKVTLGFQYNKVEQTDADLSPRLGYVTNFNKYWGAKLLHSQAFRSAVATERFLDTAVIGNPSLDPEKTTTSEIQVFYTSNNYTGAVTYFNSEIKDVIDRVNIGGQFQFVNQGEISSQGIELEINARISQWVTIIASATHQENEDANGVDSSLAPSIMGKIGISYERFGYTYALFDNYFGAATSVSEVNSSVLEVNPEPDAYHLMTFQFSMDVQKALGNKSLPNMALSIYIDNVLDENIYYPEINRKNINSIPTYSDRAFYANLAVKF